MMSVDAHILIVEDELDLAELIDLKMRAAGYQCRTANNGVSALSMVDQHVPDLIILDRMLPGISGDEVIGRLRHNPRTSSIPVIMLTAKAEEMDELVGFSLGADDYMSKPFSMKVLTARVVALLRRASMSDITGDVLTMGPISIDSGKHLAYVNHDTLTLTATEFRLLKALIAARGRVLDRSQLIDKALGQTVAVTDRTIDVHITSLRKKINSKDKTSNSARWIHTVRGIGYSLRPPDA